LDLEKPTVVSCDQGPSETIENPVIVNDICLEVGAVSTNLNTDLVLAPISGNNSRDVATLGCASIFLTEEIDAGFGSQLSSVHVEMKTQLTLDSEIPFSFMATSSNVQQNNNQYDLLEMNVDEGYVYDDSMVYCQCSRCSTLAEPYLADDNQYCLNCNKTLMANKCISEFGFICKFCPAEDACSCNLCGLESVKFGKLKNGKCSKCKDNAISSLCQKRRGICSHCFSLSASASIVKNVVEAVESKVQVQKPLNFNEHYKLQKQNTGASTKGSVPKNSKKQSVASTGRGKLKNVPKKKVVSEVVTSKTMIEQSEILPPVVEEDIDKTAIQSVSEDDEDSDPAETAKAVGKAAMNKHAIHMDVKSAIRKPTKPKSVIWSYFTRRKQVCSVLTSYNMIN
jgi:hypothetical protein